MPMTSPDWPASQEAMEAGRQFLLDCDGQRVLLTPDGDVDGLAAGVLTYRTIERLGGQPTFELARKAEHVHSESMRARIREHAPDALVVLEMGSRSEAIVPELQTLIVDHHLPHDFPRDATVVSSYGYEPVANTTLLTFILCQSAVDVSDLDWLAALGTVAAFGLDNPFDSIRALYKKYGRKHLTEAAALLNAPRWASGHDVETALHVLLQANSPVDISKGKVDGVDRLRLYRAEVANEVARCAQTAPIVTGPVALLAFQSTAKTHPLVATHWMHRLANNIVIAANYGYLPDRVSFAMRTALDVNLLDYLRSLGVPFDDTVIEHPQATGGSMRFDDFRRLVRAMGFEQAPDISSELSI